MEPKLTFIPVPDEAPSRIRANFSTKPEIGGEEFAMRASLVERTVDDSALTLPDPAESELLVTEDLAAQTATRLTEIAARSTSRELPPDQRRWSPPAEILTEQSQPSPDAISRLEQTPMLAHDKGSLLLAALDHKPMGSTALSSPVWIEGEPEQSIPDDEYDNMVQLIHDLGLHVHVLDRFDDGISADGRPTRHTTRVFIASRSAKLLDLADDAFEQRTPEDQYVLGGAFGYPRTATEAYIKGVKLSPRMVTHDAELLTFARFVLSPEHAQEELNTARDWADQTKAASPAIYQQQIRDQLGI